jgi:hypothetical protein
MRRIKQLQLSRLKQSRRPPKQNQNQNPRPQRLRIHHLTNRYRPVMRLKQAVMRLPK